MISPFFLRSGVVPSWLRCSLMVLSVLPWPSCSLLVRSGATAFVVDGFGTSGSVGWKNSRRNGGSSCSGWNGKFCTRQSRRQNNVVQWLASSAPPSFESKTESGGNNDDKNNNKNDNDGRSGSLMMSRMSQQQLLNAFTALGTADQYDAVLTGLCAKALDASSEGASSGSEQNDNLLEDAVKLLEEMNSRKITASPRSAMALIDAFTSSTSGTVSSGIATEDAQSSATTAKTTTAAIQSLMSLLIRNQCVREYGSQVVDLVQFPALRPDGVKVRCPDGKFRTRSDRLQSAFSKDDEADRILLGGGDNRTAEVTSAVVAVGAVGICETTNWFPDGTTWHDLAPEANLFVSLAVLVAVLDNFYDFVKASVMFLASQLRNWSKNQQQQTNTTTTTTTTTNTAKTTNTPSSESTWLEGIQLPAKESLPGQLGQGIYTGTIVRGLTRLLTVDTEREAQCEAASLVTAYCLGLPCYPYRPNSYEATLLTTSTTSANTDSSNDPALLSQSGILRVLIWLLAPVVMERSLHPQLIVSDPREALSYLKKLEDYFQTNNNKSQKNTNDVFFWCNNQQERDDFLRWAYLEADNLLRTNRDFVTTVSQRLYGGAATVGDCIAVMEQW